MTFEPALLPDEEKENLCLALLDEFGADKVKRGGRGELIHGCLVSPGQHTDQDRNPTASLNFRKLTYSCLGCGKSGGLLWFIATCRGGSGVEARKWLAHEVGLDGEVMDLSRLLEYFDAIYASGSIKHEPIPKYSMKTLDPWGIIHPYMTDGIPDLGLTGRGIPEDTLRHFKVGYAEDYFVGKDSFGKPILSDRIIIPQIWRGDLVGWQSRRIFDDGTAKYLNSPEFPREQTIYNYDTSVRTIIVVESPATVLKHWHAVPNIVCTFGAKITLTQMRLLEKFDRVIVWMDNDKAGWDAIDGTYDKRGNVLTEGLGPWLGKRVQVEIVDSPYAADGGDLETSRFQGLVGESIPYSIWRRPTELLCYRCEQVAHQGRCDMGLRKHGTGEVILEDEDLAKTASQDWSEDDQAALEAETKKD